MTSGASGTIKLECPFFFNCVRNWELPDELFFISADKNNLSETSELASSLIFANAFSESIV